MVAEVTLTVEKDGQVARIQGQRVAFSPYRCFKFDGSPAELKCLDALAARLSSQRGLAFFGGGPLFDALLTRHPDLAALFVLADDADRVVDTHGLRSCALDELPDSVTTLFVSAVRAVDYYALRRRVPERIHVIDARILVDLAPEAIPESAWVPIVRNIYPVNLPEVRFENDLDLLLVDCPARNLALMPNGLGYVANALKLGSIKYQVFDLDIVTYHRYHMHRLFDLGGQVTLTSGREMPTDPWQAEHYDLWNSPDVIDYFMPIIDEAAAGIVAARPKILGLSVQQCSEKFSTALVEQVRKYLPDLVVLVGGFSCYNADIGLASFPLADYMCIGEADLTVGPLVETLARGERPIDVPGVISRYDTPGRRFVPAPMPHNLDTIDYPHYEWFDLSIYRNYNGYQLVPVIASRGCRWSRCTFCAERFYWRIRSAKNFVDELEWLVDQGCTLYMFNESDLNGQPEKVLEICDEIIQRGLKVKLTGQLRIHKKSNRAYFQKLRQAGFVALRFGVDAFSENALRLQMKGYTTEIVSQNLKDCWEAGIFTEVNWVIGIPGETEADCEEGVQLILKNREYIGRLANINPLIMVNGGVYWIDPDAHNIRFRVPKDELYKQFPRALPADSWYSLEPFIDAQVRKQRFETIVLKLYEAGFPVGSWATRVIDDVRTARDRMRSGGGMYIDELARPELLNTLPNHRIYRFKDKFYAIPLALGEPDFSYQDVSTMPGVIVDSTEAALRTEIELSGEWANSRGHYEVQKRPPAAEALSQEPIAAEPAKLQGENVTAAGQEQIAAKPAISEAVSVEPAAQEPVVAAPAEPEPIIVMPETADETSVTDDEAQRRQRMAGSYMRVSSVSEEIEHSEAFIVNAAILRNADATYAVPHHVLDNLGLTGSVRVVYATSEGAIPDPLTVIGNYNLVEFDGTYYGIPQGVPVDWNDLSSFELASIIKRKSAKELIEQAREVTGVRAGQEQSRRRDERGSGPASIISPVPTLLKAVEGYNIVSYEGWVYGIPQNLGPVDLEQVDIMEWAEVIRDVSEDVVEGEIYARIRESGANARGDAPAEGLISRSLRELKERITLS